MRKALQQLRQERLTRVMKLSIVLRMPKVKFVDDNLEVDAADDANLRDVAQAEGSNIPFGCEQGICGTCLVSVPEGADHVSAIEDQEKETLEAMAAEPGQRLACQCRVHGDVTIKSAF